MATTLANVHGRRTTMSMRGVAGVAAMVVVAVGLSTRTVHTQRGGSALSREPACNTLAMASTGGPMPKNPNTLVFRWLGTANQEIVFRDMVILLDGHYDRPPRTRPLGFTKDDIKRVNAFFVGHGASPHSDHISEVPYVAQRTGAKVYAAKNQIDAAKALGLPDNQAVTVKGGEIEEFHGFVVEPIRARHAILREGATEKIGPIYKDDPLSDAEKARAEQFARDDSEFAKAHPSEPQPPGYPMMGYLFTFDSGFKLMWLDTAGPITDEERQKMQQIGTTDVAVVSYQGQIIADWQIDATLPFVKLFKPRYFIPTHHDQLGATFLDMATYPLFMAIRDQVPGTKTVDVMYRTPVCFDVKTKEMYVGP